MRDVLIVFVGLVLLGVVWTVWQKFEMGRGAWMPGVPVACTMEAKLCPDGSAVGRVGPDCEFAPCPSAPAPIAP